MFADFVLSSNDDINKFAWWFDMLYSVLGLLAVFKRAFVETEKFDIFNINDVEKLSLLEPGNILFILGYMSCS